MTILPCFCQQPVQPQHYYGPDFGYIVAFRPHDNKEWRKVMVADPLARTYIHKDLALPPLTQFQVKVKAFNSKGEGPFSLTADIYSAQDGESRTDQFPPLRRTLQHSSIQPCRRSSAPAPPPQTYLTGISPVRLERNFNSSGKCSHLPPRRGRIIAIYAASTRGLIILPRMRSI